MKFNAFVVKLNEKRGREGGGENENLIQKSW